LGNYSIIFLRRNEIGSVLNERSKFMETKAITIVGMDRIGASLGLALKQAFPHLTFIGHDDDRQRVEAAKKLGAVDRVEANLLSACSEADIVVLNVSVSELKVTLQIIGGDLQEHALVLDLSLLKSVGLKWASQYVERGHYVGVRPILAADFLGDSRSGLDAASPDLFRNSVFCIMAGANIDPQAVETAINVGRSLGATPYFLDAAEFDGLVQSVETLPRLVAAALFNTVHKASGWRDTLRFTDLTFAQATALARDSEEVAALALYDKVTTMHWLDSLIAELHEVKRWLHRDEAEALPAILDAISLEREKWLHERRKNDWIEIPSEDIQRPSLLGGLLGRRQRKDED
jgi:prephenate dehydrogenase